MQQMMLININKIRLNDSLGIDLVRHLVKSI